MASLFIKDPEAVAAVSRLAKRTGKTKTALVRELASAREAELDRAAKGSDLAAQVAELHRRFPPAAPKVAPDHKPFFDAMWGDPD